jgi:hypothetical protein
MAAQDRLAILIGAADGSFAAPVYVVLPNSSSPEAVAAGDFDGDGDVDVIVGLKDNNQVIAVLNGGSGNFALGATASTGAEPRGMDSADADGDGDLDLVVANRSGNTGTLLRNNGNATFASTTLAAGEEPRDAAFGDLDNDGDMDIVISNHDDRTISVHQNSAGSFSLSATLSVGGNDRPDGITSADLNGDGRDDIAAASGDDTPALNRVVRFFSNSASSFTGPAFIPTGSVINTSDVVAADLDCDGDLDLATANQDSNNVSVMLNGGAGVFGAATLFDAGLNSDQIIAADLQADGDDDLVSVNRNSNDISVFMSDCGTGGEPICGDGICQQGEDNFSCPGDCPAPPVCGNGICELGEDAFSCPGDCGNQGPDGDFVFTASSLPAGQQPSATAAGDFNGDQIADLAVTADLGNLDSIQVLLGTGGGSFAAPFTVVLPNSSSPESIVAGDLDGDTDIDLAVGLKDNNQVIAVINGGAANFALGATAPTGAEPRGMDIADIEPDGDLDIVVANRSGNSVTMLVNNGLASFTSTTLAAGNDPRDAAFGDLDGDGDMDALVSNHDDRTVGIYGFSGGAFSLMSAPSIGSPFRPDGIDSADVTGDGLADIVTATGDETAQGQNGIVRMTSTGNLAAMGAPAFFFAGPGAFNTSDVVLADMDCDGDLDAATANQLSGSVSVMANSGSGVFGAADLFPAGANSDHIIAGDVSGDGLADLVTTNRDSNNITVLVNETCKIAPPTPGDLDGDGDVDGEDLGALLLAWGRCIGCPADLDGNGVVDGADLGTLLLNWG